eukprot:CAMPEP_0197826656 /NCGR_PEP_ID=MMETSP1437-20131217/3584_1 /TAXON_ID=49252 ORGANISM="Eucampia antarctica, Strain CCMP1452" /NCGR_SAMPLE_ID=MMETSP1437 /ASSEMBLY_ACC=CAM_ASM_001096 /LENGTH=256 /DNA_ID=CAMNT_0043427181 /DNA_START=101 /DNA_END=871 /DNA_ORIENTATION=-
MTTNAAKSPRPIKNVVVAIAMEAEAMPFVEHLGLKEDKSFYASKTPFEAFRGEHNGCKITVVTNGKDSVYGTGVDNVGTVPAALATYLALEKLDGSADLLINAGTCGGFSAKGAEIGDVFLTTASANHDRRIQIPPFIPYGIGKVESTPVAKLADLLGAKTGLCTTANSLDAHDIDELHMKENDASIKDMEAAAIAWSCKLHDVPHFGVKVVTDIVDGDKPTNEEFMENLASAATSLQTALPKVIDHICGKGHDEL